MGTSYKYSEVSLVTPLKYLALVFVIVFGYFIWGEIPTIKTLAGALLVIISTLIIFRREIYNKKIITLDARSGKLIWELTLDDYAPRRGMVYSKREKNRSARLYFPSYKKILAISPVPHATSIKFCFADGFIIFIRFFFHNL